MVEVWDKIAPVLAFVAGVWVVLMAMGLMCLGVGRRKEERACKFPDCHCWPEECGKTEGGAS